LAGALALTIARPALGQQPSSHRSRVSPVVHYGKWAAALAFAGFTALGALEHAQANDAYAGLQAFCRGGGSCAIAPDGRYADPAAEGRYQQVVSSDRAARVWLMSGQVALGGAAALFVIDLLKSREPKNIPFQGLVIAPTRTGTHIGWKLPF
jgi:hypothetical protein